MHGIHSAVRQMVSQYQLWMPNNLPTLSQLSMSVPALPCIRTGAQGVSRSQSLRLHLAWCTTSDTFVLICLQLWLLLLSFFFFFFICSCLFLLVVLLPLLVLLLLHENGACGNGSSGALAILLAVAMINRVVARSAPACIPTHR